MPDAAENLTSRESFSQFLARVLDQLSITSWLPAMLVVASGVILGNLSTSRGDIEQTVAAIGNLSWGSIALLVGAVVLVAVFTQAFEFEAIRALEGYWPAIGPLGPYTRWRIRRHLARLEKLRTKQRQLLEVAVHSARPKARQQGRLSSEAADAFEDLLLNQHPASPYSTEAITAANRLVPSWRKYAPATLVTQLSEVERRIREYPALEHDVLPTRLGNTVRSYERSVHRKSEGRLETFAIHVLDTMPRAIASSYREQRRRLDLYCALVWVLVGVAGTTVAVCVNRFPPQRFWTGVIVCSIPLAGAGTSYLAALASGRKFGLSLVAIREHKDRVES